MNEWIQLEKVSVREPRSSFCCSAVEVAGGEAGREAKCEPGRGAGPKTGCKSGRKAGHEAGLPITFFSVHMHYPLLVCVSDQRRMDLITSRLHLVVLWLCGERQVF